jgi:hypothetical protein
MPREALPIKYRDLPAIGMLQNEGARRTASAMRLGFFVATIHPALPRATFRGGQSNGSTQATPEIKHPPLKYTEIGLMLSVFTGGATFLAAWAFCALIYGFLFGFGLGWLPAAILALLVAGATVLLWGPVVVLLLLTAVTHFLR